MLFQKEERDRDKERVRTDMSGKTALGEFQSPSGIAKDHVTLSSSPVPCRSAVLTLIRTSPNMLLLTTPPSHTLPRGRALDSLGNFKQNKRKQEAFLDNLSALLKGLLGAWGPECSGQRLQGEK